MPTTLSADLEGFNIFAELVQMNLWTASRNAQFLTFISQKLLVDLYLRESCLSAKTPLVKYKLSTFAGKEFPLIKTL